MLSSSNHSEPVQTNRRSPFCKIALATAVVAGACLVFLLALSGWNLAVTKWQHAQNAVPGDFFTIDDRRMHLYCSGTGSPTIVIEAAASADWLGWQGVQQTLSNSTRVCTYDRAGHGWSQPRPGPRDAETIARELHALLAKAGVQRPLILAGHSAGGLYVREYAREFPAEIAGVVLIDSSSPQQIDELPGFRQSYAEDKHDAARQLRWEKLRVWSGWERLMGRCHNAPSPELEHLAAQYDAEMCRPEYVGGDDSEFIYFETSCKQAKRLTSFGRVPLAIISQDTEIPRDGMTTTAIANLKVWAREQEAMKSLSPLSWRVIARGAGHAIHHDRPEVVVAEMKRLIEYLRGGPEPPFGITTAE